MPPTALSICQECGYLGPGNEYHPYAFCVLIKARQNPWEVVREAAEVADKTGWPHP